MATKKTSKPKTKPPAQKRTRTRIVRSSMSAINPFRDPFQFGAGGQAGATQSQVNFALETGRRGSEVLGLSSGPMATNLVNSLVATRRSRHAVLTNPYAKRSIDILVSNVVGRGHRMISKCSNKDFKKQVEKLWNKWIKEVESSGKMNFAAFESLAYRSMCEGGDSFVRLRTRYMTDGFSVPLQLQAYESEQLPIFKNELNGGNKIIGGIEFNPLGEPVNYWMYRNHPGDFNFNMQWNNSLDTIPIPAADILHLHDVKRPNEVRGMPILACILITLSDIDRYLDAEMERKKACALLGGFIKQTAEANQAANPFLNVDPSVQDEPDNSAIHIEAMEPGSFPILPVGYDVSFSNPADVGANFHTFMKQMLMQISMGLNILYEQLSGDYSGTNDRLIRVAMLEFKRICETYQQNILEHQFCRPVFERWFDLAVLSGALIIPAGVDDEDARLTRWIPAPWPYMNPVQDTQTQVNQARAGLIPRSELLLAQGDIPEEIDDEIKEERKRAADLGLVFTTDAGLVNDLGAYQKADSQPGTPDPATFSEDKIQGEDPMQVNPTDLTGGGSKP